MADEDKQDKKPKAKTSAKAESKPVKTDVKKVRGKSATAMKDLRDLAQTPQEDSVEIAKAAASKAKAQEPSEPGKREPKIDSFGRSYGTGRRKDAVARVWLKQGTGKVTVNGRDQGIYFGRNTHRLILNQPFLIVNRVGHFDVICTVKGGGLSGQAGAVRHGLSRALENFDPEMRPALKKAGMLTRDARIVERKKVGKHKARRTKQWAKR